MDQNSISGSSYSTSESETTTEVIEYEYDAKGQITKEKRVRTVTKPRSWGTTPWAPAPFPPYRHPVWYEQGGTGDIRPNPNWSYTINNADTVDV